MHFKCAKETRIPINIWMNTLVNSGQQRWQEEKWCGRERATTPRFSTKDSEQIPQIAEIPAAPFPLLTTNHLLKTPEVYFLPYVPHLTSLMNSGVQQAALVLAIPLRPTTQMGIHGVVSLIKAIYKHEKIHNHKWTPKHYKPKHT